MSSTLASRSSALLLTVLLLVVSSSTTNANKDDSYYKAGSGNPNIYQNMYWADADNVLEDLDKFQYLYVEFQHCAWSWMNYGNDDDDGSVDENDYWYQGKVPPMGANVAFTLYGSLKGNAFSGCSKETFINSFYTSTGFEQFVKSMKYAGVNKFYYNDYSGYSSQCQGYAGVGCDYANGFATHSYSTKECNPDYYTGVTNTMYSLNQAMQSAQCIKIYDRSKGVNWNGYNVTVSGTPLELLAYSNACFYQNFWSPDGQCPDPYGKISFYQQNFNRGVVKSRKTDPFAQYTVQMQDARRLSNLGTTMMVAAALVFIVGLVWPRAEPTVRKAKRRISHAAQIAKEKAAVACAPVTSCEPCAQDVNATLSMDDGDNDLVANRSVVDDADAITTTGSSPLNEKLTNKGMPRLFGGGSKK